jgi:hypothetical protein
MVEEMGLRVLLLPLAFRVLSSFLAFVLVSPDFGVLIWDLHSLAEHLDYPMKVYSKASLF